VYEIGWTGWFSPTLTVKRAGGVIVATKLAGGLHSSTLMTFADGQSYKRHWPSRWQHCEWNWTLMDGTDVARFRYDPRSGRRRFDVERGPAVARANDLPALILAGSAMMFPVIRANIYDAWT
jgi:hypothetical protein